MELQPLIDASLTISCFFWGQPKIDGLKKFSDDGLLWSESQRQACIAELNEYITKVESSDITQSDIDAMVEAFNALPLVPLMGMSLSLCIGEVLMGKVDADQIELIIASTKMHDSTDLEEVITMYSDSYWRKDPEKGSELARKLWNENKIVQPRVIGGTHPGVFPLWAKCN